MLHQDLMVYIPLQVGSCVTPTGNLGYYNAHQTTHAEMMGLVYETRSSGNQLFSFSLALVMIYCSLAFSMCTRRSRHHPL